MPRVPTYEPQVREQAFQPVFQQNVDVSAGSRALASGLGQLADAADRIDLRDSQDAAFKAEAKIREDWQVQRAALRNQYKKDQADQYKVAADEWWAKARDTYSAELSPRAQAMAGKSIATYKLAQDADTLGYVTAEKTQAREINFKTLQATMAREALQSATPETASAIASVTSAQLRENAIRYAAAEGLNSDVGEAMARDQVDNMHKAMAITLATQPDGLQAAQNYLAEHGKEMAPGDREAVNRQIEATSKQAAKEREEKASDAAWQLFSQGKPIPEAVMAQMDGRERASLTESMRTRSERAVAGKTVKTDTATYIDLREKLARGEKVDLRQYMEKIGPADLERLIDIQTSGAKPSEKQDSMLTDEQRVGGALRSAGIDEKKDPEAAYAVRSEVDRRVRAESAAKGGKDLTADEKQKVVDAVFMDKVYVEEWGRNPQKPLALVTPDEMGEAYVRVDGQDVKLSTVPMTDRQQIISALKKRGVQPTEQKIVELYLQNKKGK